ncbi:hypothetical protein [Roseateles sp.]|uniref:hypothetical protein n=1 Tax=Roseateles sp. TaxID=1971397 RepID=UPI0031DC36D7
MREPLTPRPTGRGKDPIASSASRMPLICLVVSVLSACAATVDPITTPRGREGFVVTCDSPEGWPACYRAAAEACDGRYRVIDRAERAKRLVAECRRGGRYE